VSIKLGIQEKQKKVSFGLIPAFIWPNAKKLHLFQLSAVYNDWEYWVEMMPFLKAVQNDGELSIDDLSDDDLMRLSALDRKDAFEILVTRYSSFVLGLAIRFMGDRQTGRDIAQDVFLSLWAERIQYRRRGVFKSYLAAVCLNRCRNTSRNQKSQERKISHLESEDLPSERKVEELPLDELLKTERAKEIRAQLQKLPEATRTVLIYRFTHDLSLKEIAALTGMPIGTVKSHVSRGLVRFERLLTKGD